MILSIRDNIDCILQVNVVKGLKLYEDIFTDIELYKLSEFVHELQIAGRKGELPGKSPKIFCKHFYLHSKFCTSDSNWIFILSVFWSTSCDSYE